MATPTLLSLRNHVLRVVKRDPGITSTEIDSYINRGVQEVAGGIRMPDGDYISPPLPDLMTSADVKLVDSTAYLTLPTNYNRDLFFCIDENDARIEIYNSFPHFLSTFPGLSRSGKVTGVCTQGSLLYYQGLSSTSTDADGVCESQSGTGSIALTIDGDLASSGSVTLGKARYVSITSAGDDSAATGNDVTFTVVGTDNDDAAQTEAVTGPNTTITHSTNKFKTITSVTPDNNTASTVTVGISDFLKIYYYKTPTDMSSDASTPDGIPVHLQEPLLTSYAIKELAPEVNTRFSKGSGIDINFYEQRFAKALVDLHLYVPYNGESLFLLGEE